MKQPDLGRKISELRLAKGLTQGELAEKCKLGLRTIQRIESAEVTPRSYTVKLIFESLDYDIYNSFGKFSYKLDRAAYRFKIWLEQFHKYILDLFNLTCIIHKLSIPMFNYRQNNSVLAKFDLKIVYYFLHQICLWLLVFLDIWTSHNENL